MSMESPIFLAWLMASPSPFGSYEALLDFDLKKHRMSMNVNIVIDDPEELERVRQKEMDITKVGDASDDVGWC